MRYTIGVSIIDMDTGEENRGIYCLGKYVAFILKEDCSKESKMDSSVLIFNNAESAQAYVRILARSYRYERKITKKQKNTNMKFYVVKVDSSNFPWNIEKEVLKCKTHKKYYAFEKEDCDINFHRVLSLKNKYKDK